MDTIELRSGGTVAEACTSVSPRASDDASARSIPWGISGDCFWPKDARAWSRWPWSLAGRRTDQPEIEQSVVLAWQRFLTVSPWEAQAVQQEIQAVFNEEFVPTASRVADRHGGRDRRVGLCQARHGERRRATAMVRTPGQEGELPGGRVSPGRDSGRHRAVGSPTVPAGDVGRGRRAAEEDARPAGGDVPDEAADRRRAGGAEFRALRLGHGRRGVRTRRRFPRCPGADASSVIWWRSLRHDRLGREADATDSGRVGLASASVGRRRFPPRLGG